MSRDFAAESCADVKVVPLFTAISRLLSLEFCKLLYQIENLGKRIRYQYCTLSSTRSPHSPPPPGLHLNADTGVVLLFHLVTRDPQ